MPTQRSKSLLGFSLIELLVSIAVLAVLLAAAAPSFIEFRQRSALRAGAEQVLSFWNEARFEAAKRNSLVRVGVQVDAGKFCLGARTATSVSDDAPCNCLGLVDPALEVCDVAQFPADQAEWRGLTYLDITTLGTKTAGKGSGVAVIDPVPAALTEATDEGAIVLAGPSGPKSYRLGVYVTALGRGVLCEPTSATHKLPEYSNRRCNL